MTLGPEALYLTLPHRASPAFDRDWTLTTPGYALTSAGLPWMTSPTDIAFVLHIVVTSLSRRLGAATNSGR